MDKKIDRFELLETIVDDLIVDIVRMLERKTSGVFYLPEEKSKTLQFLNLKSMVNM